MRNSRRARTPETAVSGPIPLLQLQRSLGNHMLCSWFGNGPVISQCGQQRLLRQAAQGEPTRKTKTVVLDIVNLSPGRAVAQDLELANRIFSQCSVRFVVGAGFSVAADLVEEWLGDEALNCDPEGISREEEALYDQATFEFGLTGDIRIFYVPLIRPFVPGFSIIRAGAPARYANIAVISTAFGYAKSLAHELGHILLNSHEHSGDETNLMKPSSDYEGGEGSGVELDPTQCQQIYENA